MTGRVRVSVVYPQQWQAFMSLFPLFILLSLKHTILLMRNQISYSIMSINTSYCSDPSCLTVVWNAPLLARMLWFHCLVILLWMQVCTTNSRKMKIFQGIIVHHTNIFPKTKYETQNRLLAWWWTRYEGCISVLVVGSTNCTRNVAAWAMI